MSEITGTTQGTQATPPPMQKSGEAKPKELDLAREQGEALQRALDHMTTQVAHDGREVRAGDYRVGYAVEDAEGLHYPGENGLDWIEPDEENVHLEISVRDGSDGRFIPGLTVHATLIDSDGNSIGTHLQPFLWHPWLYHYGRNWKVPGDGSYRLRIHIDPPAFPRHDKKNGKRYTEPVNVEFDNVSIKTGRK